MFYEDLFLEKTKNKQTNKKTGDIYKHMVACTCQGGKHVTKLI